ncbi:MAG TPA: fused MFS/spermidine synthase [Candidatus Polarisedimenticolia bacterium]|jgi:predicted membrane-bound spermidine synthase
MPVLLLITLSGCASLIYEVVWTRRLTILFGASTWAVATVIAGFLGGLAAGAWALGPLIDRSRRPLRAYALLEAGIGLYALVFPELAGAITQVYVAIGPSLSGSFTLRTLLRAVLAVVVILPPTALMGATLPAMCQFVARRPPALGRDLGVICALNTLGAAAGALLAGFVLIGSLGLSGTMRATAALNLALAITAFVLSRRMGERPAGEATAPLDPGRRAPQATVLPLAAARRAVLVAMALSGFAAVGYEVLWTRALVTALHTGFTYAFSMMLATFLAGLGLGGLLHAGLFSRSQSPLRLLARLQLLLGVWSFVSIALLGGLPYLERLAAEHGWIGAIYTWPSWVAEMMTASILVILPPTLLLGIAFPLAGQVVAGSGGDLGRRIGILYACNTVGSILGSLIAGFVLVPSIGTLNALALLAGLNILAAGWLLWTAPPSWERRATILIAASLLGVGLGVLPSDHWRMALSRWHAGRQIYFGEDATGVVEIYDEPSGAGGSYRRLFVNQTSYASTSDYARRYHKLLGHLPALLHPHPETTLVIAFGTGMTAGALARYPTVSRVDCVDLSPAVFGGACHFAAENGNLLALRKVRSVVEDGRNYLLLSPGSYDVITLEPPPPRFAGVAELYSREFYELIRSRLRPGGLAAQWIPMHSHTEEEMRMLVRSFVDAFPESTLWVPVQSDAIVIGRTQRGGIDLGVVGRHLRDPKVAADLADAGVEGVADVVSLLALNAGALARYVRDVAPITDDCPAIEFFVGRPLVETPVHLERLLPFRIGATDLLAELDGVGGPDGATRQELLRHVDAMDHFYRGTVLSNRGDRPGRDREWRLARQEVPESLFFRRIGER